MTDDAAIRAAVRDGWRFWAAVLFLAPFALYLAWKDWRHGLH